MKLTTFNQPEMTPTKRELLRKVAKEKNLREKLWHLQKECVTSKDMIKTIYPFYVKDEKMQKAAEKLGVKAQLDDYGRELLERRTLVNYERMKRDNRRALIKKAVAGVALAGALTTATVGLTRCQQHHHQVVELPATTAPAEHILSK